MASKATSAPEYGSETNPTCGMTTPQVSGALTRTVILRLHLLLCHLHRSNRRILVVGKL